MTAISLFSSERITQIQQDWCKGKEVLEIEKNHRSWCCRASYTSILPSDSYAILNGYEGLHQSISRESEHEGPNARATRYSELEWYLHNGVHEARKLSMLIGRDHHHGQPEMLLPLKRASSAGTLKRYCGSRPVNFLLRYPTWVPYSLASQR